MPTCKRVKKFKRILCIGDLIDQITLQNRDIQGLNDADVDFDELFTTAITVFSMIQTANRGTTIFDGSNTEQVVTHLIYIRFDASVTAETWIEFDGRKFDILSVVDLDERQDFMELACRERGDATQRVNFA